MPAYRWATLGCGVIGHELAQAMQALGGNLYSVGNRTHEKALAFAEKYGISKVYDRPEDIFADPDVDIVYISTPHNTHIRYLLPALSAGKHVLCEKSITLNSRELDQARCCAREHGVVLAEAMTLYHMPVYKQLAELIRSGALGPLRFIQMNFGSYKDYDMTNRFFNRSLAGGALLDIGVYALSFVRYFMSCQPDQIASQVRLAPTGVDEQAGILLQNREGEMATISLSLLSSRNGAWPLLTRGISKFTTIPGPIRRRSPIRPMAASRSCRPAARPRPCNTKSWIWKMPWLMVARACIWIIRKRSWTS